MPDPHYAPSGTLTTEQGLYLQTAANIVYDLAPPTEDATAEEEEAYELKAAGAELLVYNWLQSTGGGTITSESARGLSASYGAFAPVREMVKGAMGDSFVDAAGVAASTGYIEDFR